MKKFTKQVINIPYQGGKNRGKLLVGGKFGHQYLKLVSIPRLNLDFR